MNDIQNGLSQLETTISKTIENNTNKLKEDEALLQTFLNENKMHNRPMVPALDADMLNGKPNVEKILVDDIIPVFETILEDDQIEMNTNSKMKSYEDDYVIEDVSNGKKLKDYNDLRGHIIDRTTIPQLKSLYEMTSSTSTIAPSYIPSSFYNLPSYYQTSTNYPSSQLSTILSTSFRTSTEFTPFSPLLKTTTTTAATTATTTSNPVTSTATTQNIILTTDLVDNSYIGTYSKTNKIVDVVTDTDVDYIETTTVVPSTTTTSVTTSTVSVSSSNGVSKVRLCVTDFEFRLFFF